MEKIRNDLFLIFSGISSIVDAIKFALVGSEGFTWSSWFAKKAVQYAASIILYGVDALAKFAIPGFEKIANVIGINTTGGPVGFDAAKEMIQTVALKTLQAEAVRKYYEFFLSKTIN